MAKRPSRGPGRPSRTHGAGGGLAMSIREWHARLSVFVAPTILFFAFTGSLQVLSLHEAHGDYRPSAAIRTLSRLHKDQRLKDERRRTALPLQSPALQGDWIAPAVEGPPEPAPPMPARVAALKALVFAAALTLIVSTSLGVWMALSQSRQRGTLALVFLAGLIAPVALIFL